MTSQFKNLIQLRTLRMSMAMSTAALIATACNAAAINLVASDSNLIPSDSGVSSLSSSFDMLTGNALVVSVPVRFGNPPTDTISVDFAGQSPDYSLIEHSGDRASVGTFMFLNPATTSGTVTVSFGSSARAGYALYSLDNVTGVYADEGFSENGNGDTTHDITYEGVVDGYVINTLSGEGPGEAPSIMGDNIDVTPLYQANGDSGIFITAVSAGGQIGATGAYTTTNAYYRAGAMTSVVLYNSLPVPEPTSIALLGLCVAGLSVRRRS